MVRGGVNTLSATAIVVNGFGIVDGVSNIVILYREDGQISAVDVVQIGASLFLFTHSMVNFRTANQIYKTNQQQTISQFKDMLSKNQQ